MGHSIKVTFSAEEWKRVKNALHWRDVSFQGLAHDMVMDWIASEAGKMVCGFCGAAPGDSSSKGQNIIRLVRNVLAGPDGVSKRFLDHAFETLLELVVIDDTGANIASDSERREATGTEDSTGPNLA